MVTGTDAGCFSVVVKDLENPPELHSLGHADKLKVCGLLLKFHHFYGRFYSMLYPRKRKVMRILRLVRSGGPSGSKSMMG